MIYGDLRPANVLLGGDGHLRLADFKYARHISEVRVIFKFKVRVSARIGIRVKANIRVRVMVGS